MTYKLSITFLDEWKISTRKNLARVAANQQSSWRSSGSSGRKRERARARETRPPLACLLLARPFFLVPTTSKRLLRKLPRKRSWFSGVCRRKRRKLRNVVFATSVYKQPTILSTVSSKSYGGRKVSRQFQFVHGNFNLLTANFNFTPSNFNLPTIISIYSGKFQFYSRQFQFFFSATRLAHGILRFAHHLSATADDSGHRKSKRKIESRYLKSIFKVKSENQKSKVDLRTLMPVASE